METTEERIQVQSNNNDSNSIIDTKQEYVVPDVPVIESIIDKIDRSLAVATISNELEAIFAIADVQAQLLTYNMNIDKILKSIPFENLPDEHQELNQIVECELDVKSDSWLRLIYGNISAFNSCKVIGHSVHGKISIIGKLVNVQATVNIVEWLLPYIKHFASVASLEEANPSKSFSERFCFGCSNRIYDDLLTLQNEAIEKNPEARILIVKMDKETLAYARTLYPNTLQGVKYSITKGLKNE
jgi:hypothetical protein